MQRSSLKLFLSAFAVALTAGIQAHAGILLSDDFNSYANGELRTVGSAKWTRLTGETNNDLNVSGHQVFVDDDKHDDDTGAFTGVSSGTVYYSFTITGTSSDTATATVGDYIASFVGSVSNIGRVFTAKPTGTASGDYRLGISTVGSTGAAITFMTSDLTTSASHQVVVKFDYSTKAATMWVDPTLETDPSLVAPDTITTPGTIGQFLIRQATATNTGDYFLDNVKVGTTFADVVPEPASLGLVALLFPLLVARRRRD